MTQLIGTTTSLLETPEDMAQSTIVDACGDKYDMPAMFAASGSSRNNTLIRWMLSLSTYFLYHDIADVDVPERVIKDYDDVRADLKLVASGKMDVSFTRLEDEDGNDKTSFLYGSEAVRTHDPY